MKTANIARLAQVLKSISDDDINDALDIMPNHGPDADLWNGGRSTARNTPVGPQVSASGSGGLDMARTHTSRATQPGTTTLATELGDLVASQAFMAKAAQAINLTRNAVNAARIAAIETNVAGYAANVVKAETSLIRAARFLKASSEAIEDEGGDADDEDMEKAVSIVDRLNQRITAMKAAIPGAAEPRPVASAEPAIARSHNANTNGSGGFMYHDPIAGADQLRIATADAGAVTRAILDGMPVMKGAERTGLTMPPDLSTRPAPGAIAKAASPQDMRDRYDAAMSNGMLSMKVESDAMRVLNAGALREAGRIDQNTYEVLITRHATPEVKRLLQIH